MVKVDLLLFECLLHHAQPCAPCEWTALWDKVDPILRDEALVDKSPLEVPSATKSLTTHGDGFRARAGKFQIVGRIMVLQSGAAAALTQ